MCSGTMAPIASSVDRARVVLRRRSDTPDEARSRTPLVSKLPRLGGTIVIRPRSNLPHESR